MGNPPGRGGTDGSKLALPGFHPGDLGTRQAMRGCSTNIDRSKAVIIVELELAQGDHTQIADTGPGKDAGPAGFPGSSGPGRWRSRRSPA